MRINRELYRYTEQALRDYTDDCQRKCILEEYLRAYSPPEVHVQGGEALAEQEQIVERKAKSEEWRGLVFKTEAIYRFLETLKTADFALIKLRYFEQLPWKLVADELHAAEITCRSKWAPRIIRRAARMIFGDLTGV